MFFEYLFTDLTFFVIAQNFTRNICNLVRNNGDKSFETLPQIKFLTNTRLLYITALESRLVIEVT